MKQGIYCIKNVLNGKRYIGFSINIPRRKYQHENNFSSNENLQKDIKSVGINNFEFSVLEYVPDVELLAEKEAYWINLYKASGLYNKLNKHDRKQTPKQRLRNKQRRYLINSWEEDVNRIKSKSTNYI